MSEEELQEQIIQQIEVLVEELGGTMCHSVRCNSMGRQSKVLEIEYNVEGDQYSMEKTLVSFHYLILSLRRLVFKGKNFYQFTGTNTSSFISYTL